MEEVANLVIRVSSEQTETAKKRLKELGYAAKETETATGGLMSAWRGLSGLLAGTVGLGTAVAGLKKLLDTAKEFESLAAQLKTATGSAENAKVAFEALQDFATKTPYDLKQTVGAFVQLVNLGLTPSERALRSYGDTASATGFQLSDMAYTVARAAAGEFEPLRKFGITAKRNADGIAFTFRGVSKTVSDTAKEIEGYFIELGEKNFAGAMTERMGTLEGKLSNLGDAWDVLFATISKAGAGDLMKKALDLAISAVSELTDLIGSGQLKGYVDALLFKFESLADGIFNAFESVSVILEDSFKYWSTDGKGVVDFLIGAFKNLPENVRAAMQSIGASFGLLVEYASATGSGIYQTFSAVFGYLVATASNVGKEIWSHLKPGASAFDYAAAQAQAYEAYSAKVNGAIEGTMSRVKGATAAWQEEVTASLDERDASISAFQSKIRFADALRESYVRVREAKSKAAEGTDRLAKFGKGGKSATAEFDQEIKAMRTQAEVIQQTYERRRKMIIENTEAESAARQSALARNEQIYAQEREQLLEKAASSMEVGVNLIEEKNAQELVALTNGYVENQRALDEALAAKLLSQEDYNKRSELLARRNALALAGIVESQTTATRAKQFQLYAQVLSMGADMAGQIEKIAEHSGKGAKAAFYLAKAIAIAQAIVSTELAAMQAAADPSNPTIFGKIAAHTAIRAMGYGSVALLAATSIAGYEHGGMIPAGKVGLTNEAGAEFVRGPAVVTSARATADQLAGARGGNVTVNVTNTVAGVEIETQERNDSDGKTVDLIIRRTKREIASEVRNGTGDVNAALVSAFNLRRGAA